MDAKKYFAKYYAKLNFEAILKSVLFGLVPGFAASFVIAAVAFFTEFEGLWPAVIAMPVITAAAALVIYFKKFKPTAMSNARRVDRVGLEERLITMIEYEGDDSFIAQIQRADAKAKLAEVEASQIGLQVPQKLIIAVVIAAVLGCAMTTVSTLGDLGLLPQGDELIESLLPAEREVHIAVSYIVEEGGYVIGDDEQLVLYGGNAESVTVMADDGYAFVSWDDGSKKPTRTDTKITETLILTAIFEPIGDGEGDGDSGDGEPGDSDNPGDQPGEGQEGQGPTDNQDGQPNDAQMGGGKYDDCNQIINGETYYREVKDSFKEELEKILESDGSLTDEERKIIESYIEIV